MSPPAGEMLGAPMPVQAECIESGSKPAWLAQYQAEGLSLAQLLPPLEWLPRYLRSVQGRASKDDERKTGTLKFSPSGDAIAGVTVGIMLVPQCLAFAMLAGLPVQMGLYSSFVPLVLYCCLGTIRQLQIGPTALVSLLSGQALDSLGFDTELERIAGASLMALLVGLISILLGCLRTGFIVDFMSHSVMSAFCTASGITIATSQLHHILGLRVAREKYWWKTAKALLTHALETDLATLSIGATLLALLLTLKYWKSAGSKDTRLKHRVWRLFPVERGSRAFRALKLLADVSSLVSVTLGWFWALAYRSSGVETVRVVGPVDSTGFVFVLPGAGVLESLAGGSILEASAVIAVVGFIETMAVGGKFAGQARYKYDPNQELIALGLANVGSGFMSGFPVTGGFSRTAVNVQFGATSLLAPALTSLLVFVAAYLLLPVIALLPLCSLAPIIVQGAIGVVSLGDFRKAYESSTAELLVMLSTLLVSLALTVKEGLLAGFVLSILLTVSELANPNLAVLARQPDGLYRDVRNFPQAQQEGLVVVRMDARLNFANARVLKEFCLRAVQLRAKAEQVQWLMLDCKSVNSVDFTGAEMLEVLAETLKAEGARLLLANVKAPVSRTLETRHVPAELKRHGGHICIDTSQAEAIIAGEVGAEEEASARFTDLVARVDDARAQLKSRRGCRTRTD